MSERQLKATLSDCRMIIRSLKTASSSPPPPASPFSTLVPAIEFDDHAYVVGLAPMLVQQGCDTFIVVGPQAEALAEALDKMFEGGAASASSMPVVEIDDGANYFLVSAGGNDWALALCADHRELSSALDRHAKAMGWKASK